MVRVAAREKFRIKTKLWPRGDQPKAIRELTEGVLSGLRYQTLLGATGTGKSLGYSEPVLVFRREREALQPHLLAIGDLVETLMGTRPQAVVDDGENLLLPLEEQDMFVPSFNPRSGEVALRRVLAVSKHRAPQYMYRVRTACGREVLTTGDHNFFVLRDGEILLLRTDELQGSDYLPLPISIPFVTSSLEELELEKFLPGDITVDAGDLLQGAVDSFGKEYVLGLLKKHYADARAKLWSSISHKKGRIPLDKFKDICRNLPREWLEEQIDSVRAELSPRYSLPLRLKLTPGLLRLMGIYLAEGHAERRYILISSRDETLRRIVFSTLAELGFRASVRRNTDICIGSRLLSEFFSKLMGSRAHEKHLPPFWPQLSAKQLGELLGTFFDGDGGVEKEGIACTTASKRLAYELLYALLRLGIWARVRKKHVQGRRFWLVTITGVENLELFARNIGFSIERKRKALQELLKKKPNTNVDLIPGISSWVKLMRKRADLSQRALSEL